MKEKAEDHKDLMKMREIFNNKQYDLKNLSERDYIKKQKDFEFYFKTKEDDYIKEISNLQNIVLEREKEVDLIKEKLLRIIHDLKLENEKMNKVMTEYLNKPKNEKRLYEFDEKGNKLFNYLDKGTSTNDIEENLLINPCLNYNNNQNNYNNFNLPINNNNYSYNYFNDYNNNYPQNYPQNFPQNYYQNYPHEYYQNVNMQIPQKQFNGEYNNTQRTESSYNNNQNYQTITEDSNNSNNNYYNENINENYYINENIPERENEQEQDDDYIVNKNMKFENNLIYDSNTGERIICDQITENNLENNETLNKENNENIENQNMQKNNNDFLNTNENNSQEEVQNQ